MDASDLAKATTRFSGKLYIDNMRFKEWLAESRLDFTMPTGHPISHEQQRILRILGENRGPLSAERIRRQLPGLESNRGAYYTVTMPAAELMQAGLVEKAGRLDVVAGIGYGYAGPGSARPDKVEKDDPIRDVYQLTDKGHELVSAWLGINTRPEPIEEEPPYDPIADYESKKRMYEVTIKRYQRELEDAINRKKPRLESQARANLKKWQDLLKKLTPPS